MLYSPYPPLRRRMGCFGPFGCFVVVIGIIICVMLMVYPDSPFRLSLPNPFVQPTPVHHTKPSVRVLSVQLGHGQDVRGTPTLAADFVNRVLAAAHSPAQGTGQVLYDLSNKHFSSDLSFPNPRSSEGMNIPWRCVHA